MDDDIIRAIESSHFEIYPSIEDQFLVDSTNEYTSHISLSVDTAGMNRNRIKPAGTGREEKIISERIERYKKFDKHNIGWYIAPNSTTDNIQQTLKEFDFQYEFNLLGLVRKTHSARKISTDYSIREVDPQYLHTKEYLDLVSNSYGQSKKVANSIVDIFSTMSHHMDIKFYVGYDKTKPICFGNMIEIPQTPYALLDDAATIDDYRGQGVYTLMLHKRLEEAKRLGLTHALIQANEVTSAPKALQNGFKQVSTIERWELQGI